MPCFHIEGKVSDLKESFTTFVILKKTAAKLGGICYMPVEISTVKLAKP